MEPLDASLNDDKALLDEALLEEPAAAAPEAPPDPRRWFVILLTCGGSATNAFMFMNFSSSASLAERVFGTSGPNVSWLYSAGLLSVLPAFFVAVDAMSAPATQRRALVAMHAFNAVAAGLRLASVVAGSYALAMASSVACGLSASLVISSYTAVSGRWLPERERAMGVAALVQSNYGGWLLGAVIVPYACAAKRGLVVVLAAQAGVAGALLAAGAAFTPSALVEAAPARAEDAPLALTDSGPPPAAAFSLGAAVREYRRRPRWLVAGLAYAVAAGVGFAVPAAQDIVFSETCGFSSKVNAVANAAFIAAGVLAGLGLGAASDAVARHETAVLLGFMAGGALALAGLAATVALPRHCNELAAIELMALAGASTIGFVGAALSEASKSAGPSPAARVYSGGCVEWWVQIFGAAVTQVASSKQGFVLCAGLQGLATLLAAAALLGLDRK